MKLTPKQIKFCKNPFIAITIQVLIFWPILCVIIAVPFGFLKLPSGITFAFSLLLAGFTFFFITPLMNSIYQNFFEIVEKDNLSFIQALKLAIKRSFCRHSAYEATSVENPAPMHFLEIKAKCIDCGAENYEINKRAYEGYKLRLADNVLFQRNIEKFSEFYKDKAQQMDLNIGK
jgi:predicted nucleic-acid-binding Zn-ribbon protein